MKTQQETTIQFSGYPLSIVEKKQNATQVESAIIKLSPQQNSAPKNSIANDPGNWDIDWFNSYE